MTLSCEFPGNISIGRKSGSKRTQRNVKKPTMNVAKICKKITVLKISTTFVL
jgi:hypothetical protein